MAFAETAPLIAQLDLKGNFTPALKKAGSALSTFSSKMDSASVRFQRAGQQIGTGIRNIGKIAVVGVAALTTQIAAGLHSLIELEKATAQTEAVIRSTGGAAGQSAADIGRLSEKWEGLNATVGDEFVRAGANMLLTFTNITGKGFEPALEAVLNMNTAMGKGPEGLTSTAILVGKALNDPIKGVTALRRVGVQLSQQQEKQIKTLLKQNNLYGAQQVILGELNKEFGGSFIAQGNTTAGKVAKFTDAIEDLQRALAEALLPTLGNVADALTKTLADPSVVAGVRDFGKSLAGLISPANLATAGRILQEVFSAAKSAAPAIAAAAQIMGRVVGTAVSLFRSLPPEIQSLAVGAFAINKLTGGLVTNVAGGLIGAVLKQLVSGVVNVNGGVVNVLGAGGVNPLAAGAGAAGTLSLGAAAALVSPFVVAAAVVAATAQNKGQFDPRPLRQRQGTTVAQTTEMFGPKPKPKEMFGPPNPGFLKTGQDAQFLAAKFEQSIAPSLKSMDRNLVRITELYDRTNDPTQLRLLDAAGERIEKRLRPLLAAKETRTEAAFMRAGEHRAGERMALVGAVQAIKIPAPITNVRVNVNVTAAQVSKSVTIQRRFGPAGGSRDRPGSGSGPQEF